MWTWQHVHVLIVLLMYIHCCFYTRLLSICNLSRQELLKYCRKVMKYHLFKWDLLVWTLKPSWQEREHSQNDRRNIWQSKYYVVHVFFRSGIQQNYYISVSFSKQLNTAFVSLLWNKSGRLWGAVSFWCLYVDSHSCSPLFMQYVIWEWAMSDWVCACSPEWAPPWCNAC